MPQNGSELVLYDVNRYDQVIDLMIKPPGDLLARVGDSLPLSFAITVVTNVHENSQAIHAVKFSGDLNPPATMKLDLSWPRNVFSLSHIALPFSPTDPIYGDTRVDNHLNIGAAAPKGERKVLSLTPNYFARLRHNPFFDYQCERIGAWLKRVVPEKSQ